MKKQHEPALDRLPAFPIDAVVEAASAVPLPVASPADLDAEEQNCIPVSMDMVFHRCDAVLRDKGCALLASERSPASVFASAVYDVFRVEVKDGGTVQKVDLEKLGRSMGVLEDYERVMEHWR